MEDKLSTKVGRLAGDDRRSWGDDHHRHLCRGAASGERAAPRRCADCGGAGGDADGEPQAHILLIAGCALLALRDGEPAVKRLFWIGLALSTGLFGRSYSPASVSLSTPACAEVWRRSAARRGQSY